MPKRSLALKIAVVVLSAIPAINLVQSLERINPHYIRAYDYRVFPLAITNTGTWAFVFLFITLACTPLQRLTGYRWIGGLRRTFGLITFFYSMLHFAAYFVVGQKFHTEYLIPDALGRKSRIPGWISLAILTALAATSTDAAVRWMGGKRWKVLHRLVYVAAALAILHVAGTEAEYLNPDWHWTRSVTAPFVILMAARLLPFRRPTRA